MNVVSCIRCEWNRFTGGYMKDWIADDESQLFSGFDPDSIPGSTIYVISTKDVWMKNSQNKWQKTGSTEVL